MMKEKMNELMMKFKNAKSNEDVSSIIKNNRSVLTDDDLEQVNGGTFVSNYICQSGLES